MFVAKVLGLGDINDLDALRCDAMRRMLAHDRTARGELEEHDRTGEEGTVESDPVKERQGIDGLLAKTEIGRLLQERNEIAEQILDRGDAHT